MSNARNLADIVTGNFDVPLGALDNVPPSNDASALTTGTLNTARLAYTPVNKAGDTMTGQLTLIDGVAASRTGFFTTVNSVETTSDRELGYSLSWTVHQNFNITLTKASPVFIISNFARGYESGPVRGQCRIVLSGSTVYEGAEFDVAQQYDANAALGSHGFSYIFGNVSAGTYNVQQQVRQITNPATWRLNGYQGADKLTVMY